MKKTYIIFLIIIIAVIAGIVVISVSMNKRTVVMSDNGQEYYSDYKYIEITSKSDLKILDEVIANMEYQHDGADEMFGIIGGLAVTASEIIGNEKIEYIFRTNGRAAKLVYDVKTGDLKKAWMYKLNDEYFDTLRALYKKYYYMDE